MKPSAEYMMMPFGVLLIGWKDVDPPTGLSSYDARDQAPMRRSRSVFSAGYEPAAAVLMISAHGFIDSTAVTAMAKPRTIHDFYGSMFW